MKTTLLMLRSTLGTSRNCVTGTILSTYSYTPYGQAEVLTAGFTPDPDGKSDSDNDITFTGQRFDAESGLMLYRHRFYHTGLGTFCSRDPIGYQGSEWSLYEYVGGRVLVMVDPSGRFEVIVPGSDPLMPGNQPYVYFPILTPADRAALATCSSIYIGLVPCAGCSAEKCREAVLEFIRAKNQSWLIGVPFYRPLGTNTCGRQASDIVKRVPNLEDNPCVAMVGVMVQNVSEGAWHPTRRPSHAYARMVLCNGQTINADNGAWGGPDRIWVGPRR
jgi:RHS repeat-associated protein